MILLIFTRKTIWTKGAKQKFEKMSSSRYRYEDLTSQKVGVCPIPLFKASSKDQQVKLRSTSHADVCAWHCTSWNAATKLRTTWLCPQVRRCQTVGCKIVGGIMTTSGDPLLGPATTQNLVVKFDGEICGGVLVENASDDFPQQKKLENLLLNFAGSSPPISPKTLPTSLWKSLVLTLLLDTRSPDLGRG